jgi:hypothetical protein
MTLKCTEGWDTFHPDRFRAEGYAWGTTTIDPPGRTGTDGQWLTVLGSYHENIPLTETPDAAPRPATVLIRDGRPERMTLARVQRVGQTAFRILAVANTYTPDGS